MLRSLSETETVSSAPLDHEPYSKPRRHQGILVGDDRPFFSSADQSRVGKTYLLMRNRSADCDRTGFLLYVAHFLCLSLR
jgi:hypothetical protein